jgi:DNA-binding MarR family transcriptional regulator
MTKDEGRRLLDNRAGTKLDLEAIAILRLLLSNPETSASELSLRTSLIPRTVYRRLELLADMGLLTRKDDRWRVDLTPMKEWPTLKEYAAQQADKLRAYDRQRKAKYRARIAAQTLKG